MLEDFIQKGHLISGLWRFLLRPLKKRLPVNSFHLDTTRGRKLYAMHPDFDYPLYDHDIPVQT